MFLYIAINEHPKLHCLRARNFNGDNVESEICYKFLGRQEITLLKNLGVDDVADNGTRM